MANGENHIGEIYSIPNVAENSKNPIKYKNDCHQLGGMGNLSERMQKNLMKSKKKPKGYIQMC